MASARQEQMLQAGARAPDFQLQDLNGSKRSLASLLSAGPVLLAFFKSSCPVCQLTFPFLERIYRGQADGAARIYAVSQDDPETTREFNHEFGITFPTLLDRAERNYPASNAYGITHVPTMFLIESDGTIAWASTGFVKKELESLGGKFGVNPFRPEDRVPEWQSG